MAWAIARRRRHRRRPAHRPRRSTRSRAGFADWYDRRPADVGIQTRAVLSAAGRDPTGATMTARRATVHARTGRTAGNGSLMRTGPVALAYLDDPAALVEAATAVSALTHYDQRAQEACALWCLAIRHAVLHRRAPTSRRRPGAPRPTRRPTSGASCSTRPRPARRRRSARTAGSSPPCRRPGRRSRTRRSRPTIRLRAPRRRARDRDPDRRRHRHRRRDRRRAARRPLGDERRPRRSGGGCCHG